MAKFNPRDSIRLDYSEPGNRGCRYTGFDEGGDPQAVADALVTRTRADPFYEDVVIDGVARVIMGDDGPQSDRVVKRLKVNSVAPCPAPRRGR